MRCISPKLIWPHRSVEWQSANEEYAVSVPCGKCLACLSNKRMEWIFRLEQEHKYSSSARFVTLTYDEKHLRSDRSLCKKDVQLYMKRLRKAHGKGSKIRYYLVGEYGEVSGRPHYHILLFNALEQYLRTSWMDAKGQYIGIVHVGNVTQASIAYCTKYVIQRPEVMEDGREAPFALMSRGYGIGGRYLSDGMVQWHRENAALYAIRDRVKVRLSRFYRSKIWYREDEREAISKIGLSAGLDAQVKESRYFEKRYGELGEAKYIEFRDAMLSRIYEKVAWSQSL